MAEFLTEYITDLAKPPQLRTAAHQFAMGDNNAYTFTALVCNSADPEAGMLAGTVSGTLLRPDGATVALEGVKGAGVQEVNVNGVTLNATPCSVTLPQACFAFPGRVLVSIKLTEGTTSTTVLAITGTVIRTETDAAVDPGEILPDLASLQAAAAEALDAAAEARSDGASVVAAVDGITIGSYNMLDIAHAVIQNGYLSATQFVVSANAQCIVFPAIVGKTFTFSRKNAGSRLAVYFSTTDSSETHAVSNGVASADYKSVTYTCPSGYPYVYIWFYRAASDPQGVDWCLEEAQIVEGSTVKPYQPFGRAISVDAAHLAAAVNADIAKGVAAYNETVTPDSWNTRRKVYGVQFDTAATSPACTRIADAAPLIVSDFDNVYPWCEMRRCAVTISGGKKSIVYEGETGYSVNGSAGNVMVEIPAFYVCREKIGTTERWLISGTQYGGFELHPWFIEPDGSAVTHRYYGAYEAQDSNSGIFSRSGATPYKGQNQTDNYLRDKFAAAGFRRHTIQAWSALQYLFVIEHATRNSQSVYNGSTYQLYFYPEGEYSACEIVRAITTVDGHSRLQMDRGAMYSGNSLLFASPGEQVYIGTTASDGSIRTILAVSSDENSTYVTVDGALITLTTGLAIAGIPQYTGHTDALTTPSGYAPGEDTHVAPFRYRGIENPWGNLWEVLDGLWFKNGVWYITNDPSVTSISAMDALTYAAPKIAANDKSAENWISGMGYDVNNRAYALPGSIFTDAGTVVDITTDAGVVTRAGVTLRGQKYYGDALYTTDDTSLTLFFAVGGGWDHHENAGLFCYRGLVATGYLYGERITC